MCEDIILSNSNIGDILNYLSCFLSRIMPILITLAVLGFVWGVMQYYLNPENEEKRKKGKDFIIWGLVALFVIVCVWGLVGVLANTFGVKVLVPQIMNS